MSPIFMAWFSDYLLAVKYSSMAAITDNAVKARKGKKKPEKIADI
jgi:hypothetical protein